MKYLQGCIALSSVLVCLLTGCATSLRTVLPGPVSDAIRQPVAPRTIRVALGKSTASATVNVAGPGIMYDCQHNRTLQRFVTLPATTFTVGPGGMLAANGRSIGCQRVSIVPDAQETLWIDSILYRGKCEVLVNDSGTLTVVNILGLEEYLLGVVPKETFPSWPREALRAQAVAARGFAMYHFQFNRKREYDIVAPLHQLYGGVNAETPSTTKAVYDTEGQYLEYKGAPLCAFFGTCCGGRTEYAPNIFPDVKTFPASVAVDYCKGSPHYAWTYSVSRSVLEEKLKRNGKSLNGPVSKVEILKRFASGRVALMRIYSSGSVVDITGEECRKILGYNEVKSTLFSIRISGGRLVFSGRGWGHGVGLCQWGSKGMADKGFSYEEILKQYYPGAVLVH